MLAGRSVLAAIAITLSGSLVGACSETASVPTETTPSTARGHVIATVVTHDARVKILSSAGGDLRVVVWKLDGTLVADGVPLSELQRRDPELYDVVTSARAGYIDATLDRDHIN